MKRAEKRVNDFLNDLSGDGLKEVHIVNATGKPERLTAEGLLVHIFEE